MNKLCQINGEISRAKEAKYLFSTFFLVKWSNEMRKIFPSFLKEVLTVKFIRCYLHFGVCMYSHVSKPALLLLPRLFCWYTHAKGRRICVSDIEYYHHPCSVFCIITIYKCAKQKQDWTGHVIKEDMQSMYNRRTKLVAYCYYYPLCLLRVTTCP